MYKVVLVDDERSVRQELRDSIYWKNYGFEVVGEAVNGKEALEVIKQVKPDLVITDIHMPVLNGLDLIKEVLREESSHPKFIIISEYSDFQYTRQAVRYGAHDFILKPINVSEIEFALNLLFQTLTSEDHQEIIELRTQIANGEAQKAKQYVDLHFRDNISLKTIAAKLYLHPVYLGQLFKKTYGIYFKDYLLQLRIKEAKKLLRQSELKVYEIAENAGFQNTDYFVTAFRKFENLTPTEYRSACRNTKMDEIYY